jgi:chemotaxis protein methyltransferase CheR
VLGTDINKAALAHAQAGRYGRWSLRGDLTPAQGMLRPLPDGGAEVASWLRDSVRFDYLNLHDPIYPSLFTGTQGLDIIFCRNVLVYFVRDAAERVLARLADCLAEGGWLIVGALDVDLAPPTLARVRADGVTLLTPRRAGATPTVRRPAARPSSAPPLAREARASEHAPFLCQARASEHAAFLCQARAAADRGALDEAIALAQSAVAAKRTAAALHLLALLLGERGDEDKRLALLAEVVTSDPDDALAHLALGLSDRAVHAERHAHLQRVLGITAGRLDGERLPGPEPLPVSWVRKLATAALRRLEAPE